MDRNWGSVFDSLETILHTPFNEKGIEQKRDVRVHVQEPPVVNTPLTKIENVIRQDPDVSTIGSNKRSHFSQNPKYMKILAKRKFGDTMYHFYDRSLEEVREERANRLFEFIEKETNRRKTHLRHVIMEKAHVLERREELKREKQQLIENRHQRFLAKKAAKEKSRNDPISSTSRTTGPSSSFKQQNVSGSTQINSKSNNATRSIIQDEPSDVGLAASNQLKSQDVKISDPLPNGFMPAIEEANNNAFSNSGNGGGERLLNWKTFNSFHQKYLHMDTNQLEKPRYHGISDGSGNRRLKERVRTNNFGTGKTSDNFRAMRQMLTKNVRDKMQTINIYRRTIIGEEEVVLASSNVQLSSNDGSNRRNNGGIRISETSQESGLLKRDGTMSKSSNYFVPSSSSINVRRSPNDVVAGSTRSNLDMNRSPSYQGSGMLKSDASGSNIDLIRRSSQVSSQTFPPERRQTQSSVNVNPTLGRQQTLTQPLQVPNGKRMSFASSGPSSSSFGSNINNNNQMASSSSVDPVSILNRQNSFQTDAIKEFIELQNQSGIPAVHSNDVTAIVNGMIQRQTTMSTLKRQGTLSVPKGTEFGSKHSSNNSILGRQSTLAAITKSIDGASNRESDGGTGEGDKGDVMSRKPSFGGGGGRQGGFMIRRMTTTLKTTLTPEMSSVIKQHRDLFDPSLTQDDDEPGFDNQPGNPFLDQQITNLSLSSEPDVPIFSDPTSKAEEEGDTEDSDHGDDSQTPKRVFSGRDVIGKNSEYITPERWVNLAAPLTHYAISEMGRVLYPSGAMSSSINGIGDQRTRILRSLQGTSKNPDDQVLDLSSTVPVFYSTVRFFPTTSTFKREETTTKIEENDATIVGERKTPRIDYNNILDTARKSLALVEPSSEDPDQVYEGDKSLRLIQTMSILGEFPVIINNEKELENVSIKNEKELENVSINNENELENVSINNEKELDNTSINNENEQNLDLNNENNDLKNDTETVQDLKIDR